MGSLYGEAGTGKSSLINAVIGASAAKVSHSMASSASRVESFRVTGPDKRPLLFVEAPGEDISNNDSTKLAGWL